MRNEIVLIGPFGAGKSTIGRMLAEHLGLPSISMDSEQHYYEEAGFNREHFLKLWKEASPWTAELYFYSFFPAAVRLLLSNHRNCVFDLGAGHTVYTDPKLFADVKEILAPFPNVVLVLPGPDPDESIRVLRAREEERRINPHFLNTNELDYFAYWVKSPHNFELAKHTVYTEGKTPEETRDEVLQAISL